MFDRILLPLATVAHDPPFGVTSPSRELGRSTREAPCEWDGAVGVPFTLHAFPRWGKKLNWLASSTFSQKRMDSAIPYLKR